MRPSESVVAVSSGIFIIFNATFDKCPFESTVNPGTAKLPPNEGFTSLSMALSPGSTVLSMCVIFLPVTFIGLSAVYVSTSSYMFRKLYATVLSLLFFRASTSTGLPSRLGFVLPGYDVLLHAKL